MTTKNNHSCITDSLVIFSVDVTRNIVVISLCSLSLNFTLRKALPTELKWCNTSKMKYCEEKRMEVIACA